MKKFIFMILPFFLLAGCGNNKDKFIIQSISPIGYDESAQKLQDEIKKQGFAISGVVEHKKIADENNITIRPQKIITYTDPKIASTLISCNPTMGMEVPFKVLVWQDYEGKVYIEYINPEYWSLTHNIKDQKCLALVNGIKADIEEAVKNTISK
jgi:uncharacterized protein (DUF302 family)